ncbi:transposase [Streptomyces chartreusis]|uniref:transposase n=1 Tax=Streptomyces chartreusis TaxID=1969 RepID=UPI00381C4224
MPSQSWEVNRGWTLAANVAADLDAWVRLLALHNIDDLADAEPDTMRFRLYHLPARLADHARRRYLRIERAWPWAKPFTTCWHRLTTRPTAPRDKERSDLHDLRAPWNPGAPGHVRGSGVLTATR